MPDDAVIRARALTCRFGDVVAVDGLDFDVHRGEVFGFLGQNGAGKTTTVRLLNGVLEPASGAVEVLGLDPVRDGVEVRQQSGVLTETSSVDGRLTAEENLLFWGRFYGLPERELATRAAELLREFGLAERARDRVSAFSTGMRQRLALARALLHRPELLFLDEPTAGLDPLAARHVHELIEAMSRREGRTVFLCTHNLVEAQRLCDRVAVLGRGRILALGTTAELGRRLGAARVGVEVDPSRRAEAASVVARAVPAAAIDAGSGGALTIRGVGRDAVPAIVAALVADGIPVYRAASAEATLEDIYFGLLGSGGAV
ncbi:MAG TPA: ABC transporter ATP-binding protein [Longimicrobiales bacterium]|nr:ABC transporter ATP-binding protein [Longimicrobiales bacterium]